MISPATLAGALRDVKDFPKEGIVFKDITPVLKDPELFAGTIDLLATRYADRGVDYVVGIESRGFIFASALALRLGAGFIPIRKPGKLPCPTHEVRYDLEYGSDAVQIHRDAIEDGKRVVLVDDLLATGGTAAAAIELIERCGGLIEEVAFLVELDFLKGREKLGKHEVHSLIHV